DLTVNVFASSIGDGNMRLFAGSGNIVLNDKMSPGSGHLSIIAEKSIMQNALILTSDGTIEFKATDNITMKTGVITSTANNVLYETMQGDITINEIDAQQGNVGIVATNGSINLLDNNGEENIIAHGLILNAGKTIDPIKTSVSLLTAMSGGDLIVENTNVNGVTIDEITLEIFRIESDGVTPETPEAFKFSDVTAKNEGAISLNSAGSITVNDGDDDNIAINASEGTGNILLLSQSDAISIQSKVDAGTGSISLIADSSITAGSADNTESHIMTTDGTIDMQATDNITIFDGNTISANANIRMFADEVMTIGSIQANGASVSLTANNITDSGTDDLDILAKELMIQSIQGVGTIDNMLDIAVETLSANVNDAGIFIHEMDGIHIDDVGEISVNRVAIDGSLEETALLDTISAGIVSKGDVQLHVDNGDTIINQITSQGNITITNDAGSIIDHADDQTIDLTAGNEKLITLTVAENIQGNTTDTFLEVADASIINAYST
ncbi:MAG: hypothetical protein OMM_12977, partial [Candidatus Magnetoglobus multicellularis str. Araruama]